MVCKTRWGRDVSVDSVFSPFMRNLPDLGASHWRQEAEMSPKLKRLDLAYSQAKTEEKIVRSRMMPMIGLTAGNSLEGPITNCAPVKNNNINTWWVGVKLSMNLSA